MEGVQQQQNSEEFNNDSRAAQLIGAVCNSPNEPENQSTDKSESRSETETVQNEESITKEINPINKVNDKQIDIMVSKCSNVNKLECEDIKTCVNNQPGEEIVENESNAVTQMSNVVINDSTNIVILRNDTASPSDSVAPCSINESEMTPAVTSQDEKETGEANNLKQSKITSDDNIILVTPSSSNQQQTLETPNETVQETNSSVFSQITPATETMPSTSKGETSDDNIILVTPSSSNQQQTLETPNETVQETNSSVFSQITPASDTMPSTSTGHVNENNIETTKTSATNDLLLEVQDKSETSTIEVSNVNIYTEDKGPKIYNITDNIVSKPIIPTKLVEAFSTLPVFGRPKNRSELVEFQDAKIKEFVGCGLDDSEFWNLADYCSPGNLRTGKELVMDHNPGQGSFPMEMNRLNKNTKTFTSDHNLSIVRKHKLRLERDIKNLYSKRNKYRGIRMMSLANDDDDNTPVVTLGTPVQPGRDLLFVIRWYRPFAYNPRDRYQYRSRHSVFSCNAILLGRQKLSLLRDRVVCPNDVDMRVDVADRPDDLPHSSAKEMFPSGFLFINNVFYVDKRPGCVDYSLPLRRWAKEKGIGDFQMKDMADVSLDQLDVRLGHPEVYVHQGNCEHLFTISEIRLVNASDPLKINSYPRHTAFSQNQTIYCTTCAEFGAKWIVVGCDRVPFDPAFFCEKCFKMYLYKDGQKLGQFKAYLYRGNEINVLKPLG